MTAPFYATVLALWGEEWRPELRALLKRHGFREPSPATLWRWKLGKFEVPGQVMHLLEEEHQTRKHQPSKEAL
jgi:hypothetical protein